MEKKCRDSWSSMFQRDTRCIEKVLVINKCNVNIWNIFSIFLRELHLHLLFLEADILVKNSQGFIKQIWRNSFCLFELTVASSQSRQINPSSVFLLLKKKSNSVALVMNLFLIHQLCWKYLCIWWNSITVINHTVKQVS